MLYLPSLVNLVHVLRVMCIKWWPYPIGFYCSWGYENLPSLSLSLSSRGSAAAYVVPCEFCACSEGYVMCMKWRSRQIRVYCSWGYENLVFEPNQTLGLNDLKMTLMVRCWTTHIMRSSGVHGNVWGKFKCFCVVMSQKF